MLDKLRSKAALQYCKGCVSRLPEKGCPRDGVFKEPLANAFGKLHFFKHTWFGQKVQAKHPGFLKEYCSTCHAQDGYCYQSYPNALLLLVIEFTLLPFGHCVVIIFAFLDMLHFLQTGIPILHFQRSILWGRVAASSLKVSSTGQDVSN